MPIFDTHCHYNLNPILENWRAYHQQAQSQGIHHSLIVGTTLASSRQAIKLATTDNSLFAAIGIHPTEAPKLTDVDTMIQELSVLAQTPYVKAIGEIGLDFYRLDADDREIQIRQQEQLFIAQLKLATKLQLPIVLHVRDLEETAYLRALDLYRHYAADHHQAVIFHCVSGPMSYLKQAMALPNSYFGFDGNLTFKNAANIREIFTMIQNQHPEKILLETDAPYLAPEPHRGKICEPAMLTLTARFAVDHLSADLALIYANSHRALNIKVA